MTSLAGYEASDERLRNGQSLKTCPHVQLCQHHIPSRRRLPPRQARAVATHRAGAALLHTQLSPERTLPPKRHAPRYPHAEALDYHAFALCAHAQGCCSTSMLSIPRHAGDLSCMDQCLLYAPVCSHSPTVSRLTCYLSQHHTQTCNEAPCSETAVATCAEGSDREAARLRHKEAREGRVGAGRGRAAGRGGRGGQAPARRRGTLLFLPEAAGRHPGLPAGAPPPGAERGLTSPDGHTPTAGSREHGSRLPHTAPPFCLRRTGRRRSQGLAHMMMYGGKASIPLSQADLEESRSSCGAWCSLPVKATGRLHRQVS